MANLTNDSSFYVVIWIASLLIYLISLINKKSAYFLAVPVIVFSFILAGIRGEIFPDVIEYYRILADLSTASPFSTDFQVVHGEIGFKLLSWGLLPLLGYPWAVMVFFAFVSCFLMFYIAKRYSLSLPAVWLVYYSTAFLLKDLGQVRNSLASLLVVDGVLMLGRRGAIFRFLVASLMFQYGAVFAYMSRFIRLNRWFPVLLLAAAGASQLLDFDFLVRVLGNFGYMAQYEGTVYVESSAYNALPALARVVLVIVVAVFIGRGMKGDYRYINMRSALLCSLLFYLAFAGIPILSQRLGGYLLSVDAFMCALLLQSRHRHLAGLWIVIYAAFTFYFNITNREFLREGYESILFY